MAVLLDNSVFLHIPKTGGTWVTRTLESIGMVRWKSEIAHIKLPQVIEQCPDAAGKFTFATVRHPLSWWRSRWSIGQRPSHVKRTNEMSVAARTKDFASFIEWVLEFEPAFFTKRVRSFLGKNFDALDFVGRQENLRADVISALQAANENLNPRDPRILESEARNVSQSARRETELPNSLKQRLLNAERAVLEHFSYDDDPDHPSNVQPAHLAA